MVEPSAAIRHIEWRELFPWLILFRTFRLAISPTVLALATAAVLLAPLGWHLAARAFLTRAERADRAATGQLIPQAANSQLAAHVPPAHRSFFPLAQTAILDAYFDIAEPLKRFFQLEITLREAAYYAFGFLWTLALWSLPGAYITRIAVVQLATDAPPGITPTFHFAARRYHWYFLAPLYPLLGVVLLATPIALMGLLLRASVGAGVIVAGLLWLLVVLFSLAAMWLLVGLLLGWPLMWPTISAERDGDPFEAFSRSYSYVYGKPLRYFFYVVVAALFGALCWAAVEVAARIVQEFGFWALSWGGGRNIVADIRDQALDVARGEDAWLRKDRAWQFGTTLIGLALALIHAATAAFRYTYFFAVASAIYLLLRHDVDEKELDEVYTDTLAPLSTPPDSTRTSPA
jgi:hypothetical protein